AYRRDAFDCRLDRCRHRPRIDHIDGMVGAVVDPGQTQVWLPAQHLVDRQLYTVNRRAAAGIGLDAFKKMMHRVQPQRVTDGDGMSHAALWLIRSDDDHLPQVPDGLYQVAYPRCTDAVVIGYEDHRLTFAALGLDLRRRCGFGGGQTSSSGRIGSPAGSLHPIRPRLAYDTGGT